MNGITILKYEVEKRLSKCIVMLHWMYVLLNVITSQYILHLSINML